MRLFTHHFSRKPENHFSRVMLSAGMARLTRFPLGGELILPAALPLH
jgi:hypothetical protein